MPAVTPGDIAYSMLPVFKRKVDNALAIIQCAVEDGRVIGVSCSTGKDSIVVLDLVRQVYPDAPAAFFDSGTETEYPENYTLAKHYELEILPTQETMADLCRHIGALGHEPEEPGAEVSFGGYMVIEPALRFMDMHGLDTNALGLRAGESYGRRMNFRTRGKYYEIASWSEDSRTFMLCPIADWSDNDVWAYIASRKLRYNPVYDRMADAGFERRDWRVSVLIGASASMFGRYGMLRMIASEKFNELARDFPELRRLT